MAFCLLMRFSSLLETNHRLRRASGKTRAFCTAVLKRFRRCSCDSPGCSTTLVNLITPSVIGLVRLVPDPQTSKFTIEMQKASTNRDENVSLNRPSCKNPEQTRLVTFARRFRLKMRGSDPACRMFWLRSQPVRQAKSYRSAVFLVAFLSG